MVYVASHQRALLHPLYIVPIPGVETGFERGVGWDQVKKMRVYALISIPYISQVELSSKCN